MPCDPIQPSNIWPTAFVGALLWVLTSVQACSQPDHFPKPLSTESMQMSHATKDTATLAGGCYWCIEAVFQRLEGVDSVVSGFSGGTAEDADYKTVCTGTTKHAEVCQITFDPSVISFADILQVFFSAHDPTTLNRQGNDVGPQYRSAIFYHSREQQEVAEAYIKQLTTERTWPDPIVTEVTQFTGFYPAAEYHQNYYNQNGSQPYCSFVVRPKVEKFMKHFKDRLKDSYRESK